MILKSDFLDYEIDEEEEQKKSPLYEIYGPLDGKDKFPQFDIFEVFDESDRIDYKIGEYQYIFDPVSGKKKQLLTMSNFYGKDILLRLRSELKDCNNPSSFEAKNFISSELYSRMERIYQKKNPNSNKDVTVLKSDTAKIKHSTSTKKQPKGKGQYSGDDFFLRTKRKLPRNENYLKVFKGRGTVYEWLWANIIRKGWNDTEDFPLKAKYYDAHFLVCSASISKIADICGMSKNTVDKYIKVFEEAGVIRIDYLKPKGKKRGQGVYILGEWRFIEGEYFEFFYRDEVFE